MRRAMLLTAMIAIGFSSVPAGAARDYYKWTDDEGVTHYSARPPHNRVAEVVSVTTGERTAVPASGSDSSQGSSASTPDTESDTQTAATDPAKLKDPERCQNARDNLEVLSNNAKVRMRNESGDIHYLTEEEKAEKSREFQKAIDESC